MSRWCVADVSMQRRRRVGLQLAQPAPRRHVHRHQRRDCHRPGLDAQFLRARLALEAQREGRQLEGARLRWRQHQLIVQCQLMASPAALGAVAARDATQFDRPAARARLRHAGVVEHQSFGDVYGDAARDDVTHLVAKGARLARRGLQQRGRFLGQAQARRRRQDQHAKWPPHRRAPLPGRRPGHFARLAADGRWCHRSG